MHLGISVTFRTLDFRNKSHQTKLPNATDITEEIYRNAQNLFQESWMRQPLRLLGVSLTGLTDDSFEQLSFFEDTHKKERQQKLDAALDSIRLKYGNDKDYPGQYHEQHCPDRKESKSTNGK